MKKLITYSVALVFTLQLAACGTLMYPERRNQKAHDEVDATVAVLDGLALLLFLVPGVVAFAVDFSNNSIYLPKGGKSALVQGVESLSDDIHDAGKKE